MPPQRSAGTNPEAERPRYAGQYLLEAELGSGGMGVVHLARSASGLRLAVKVVHAEFAQDPEFRGRFRQEVAAARRVSGAFTAPVVDADPEAGNPWMATLFIPGPTLSEHVKRNGAMPPARLRQLMAGLAEALRDIHRAGVVHRDLKPSNVLLAEDGPKVIDFGISRPSDSELRTETGKLIGTPPFMAPEQFRRPREVGPAADVFALGSVIVHAATGSGPFDSDSPYLVAYQVVHDEPDLTGVPEELSGLVARCLAKEPEDRPTPDEVMTALRSVSASYDTQAFIPEQRGSEPEFAPSARSGHRPDRDRNREVTHSSRRPKGAPGSVSAEGTEEESPARRKSRARRLRLAALAVAVLAVGAGGLVLLDTAADSPSPAAGPSDPSQSSNNGFRPWDISLSAGGVKATGVPQCSSTPQTLYCARSGVLAAAIDPADGEVLWSRGDSGQRKDGTVRAPVLSGGLLHVIGRGGGRLSALDPVTGKTRWSRDIARSPDRITHVGGVVLLTGEDSQVTALDAATGEERWRRTIPGQSVPTFRSYGDGLAYAVSGAGDGTQVTAVDPKTGATRWQRRLDGALTLVGARDGTLWFTSTALDSSTDAVVRYDAERRTVRRIELPLPLDGSQAVVSKDTVYLLATGGAVAAVDTQTSRQLWRLETSVSFASAPVVAGQRLYFTAADGRLLAVDTAEGTLLGQTNPRLGGTRGVLISGLPTPVPTGGNVYSGAPDGSLFAVDGHDPADW
ncbi:PQQ-binding-like beta-propeller repeat protein [Streptomyces phyllanthi]|uniref:Serine/threonine-protein kinase n=1 Tax=Streptomyces phyllanthi TaxID=1803180 RepID=A0A5N8WEH7_9ACTN|nr:serine/threonine-protein kinase [Streptomyces phyllanthi]MPY45532.1 serine/threonine-protein kinase [Streptomyces phyllanthi]